jgi:hypothetical protein
MTETKSTGQAIRYPDGRIIIFARPPIAGQVKTRLAATIGIEAAARVYRELFSATVAMVAAASLAEAVLYIAGDIDHPWVISLAKHYRMRLAPQHGEDLGERMYNALATELVSREHCVLIGTDSPVLAGNHIDRAFAQLANGNDTVIGPAEDGGYVLIGAKSVHREWFEKVDWGTARVLAQTRDRVASTGCRLGELDVLWDVDCHADLVRWQSRATQQ